MILLSEFLKKLFSTDGNPPPVWIYDGEYPDEKDENGKIIEDDGLLCLFKSQFVPEYSLSDRILSKSVVRIYWTPKGIALGVEDGED